MPIKTWFEKCEEERATERSRDAAQLLIPGRAYRDILERQAGRDVSSLSDLGGSADDRVSEYAQRERLASEFGDFIAYGLGKWDWFINPISFRDRHPDLEFNPKTGKRRNYRSTGAIGKVRLFVADPRLKGWMPDYRGRINPSPPVNDLALAEIKDYLFLVQEAAEQPISWMIAEEFGRAEGRYHCHLLVAGVAHLRRDVWWQAAFERFGITRIEPFDAARGAAFYCAKYASKQLGAIHFGGPLLGEPYAAVLEPGPNVGRVTLAASPEMPRDEFRRSDAYPRGFSSWRSKR